MDDTIICAFCGLCRYNHDVSPFDFAVEDYNKWKEAVGNSMLLRAVQHEVGDPMVCVEHFSTVFRRPVMVSEEEKTFFDNFFHDHNYGKIKKWYKNFEGVVDMFNSFVCSMCSENVDSCHLIKHAADHIGMALKDLNTACTIHAFWNPWRIDLQCNGCIVQQKEVFLAMKHQAQLCFPQLTFRYVHGSAENNCNLKVVANFSSEYLKTRPKLRNFGFEAISWSEEHEEKYPANIGNNIRPDPLEDYVRVDGITHRSRAMFPMKKGASMGRMIAPIRIINRTAWPPGTIGKPRWNPRGGQLPPRRMTPYKQVVEKVEVADFDTVDALYQYVREEEKVKRARARFEFRTQNIALNESSTASSTKSKDSEAEEEKVDVKPPAPNPWPTGTFGKPRWTSSHHRTKFGILEDFNTIESLANWVEGEGSATAAEPKDEVEEAEEKYLSHIDISLRPYVSSYLENPHPSPEKLVELSETFATTYSKIFETFRKLREVFNEKCVGADNCARIQLYLEHEEYSLNGEVRVQEGRRVVEEELAKRDFGEKISIGHIHMLADISRLSPKNVRREICVYRRKRNMDKWLF